VRRPVAWLTSGADRVPAPGVCEDVGGGELVPGRPKAFKTKGTPGLPEGIQIHISGLWEKTELPAERPETGRGDRSREFRLPLSTPPC